MYVVWKNEESLYVVVVVASDVGRSEVVYLALRRVS